MDESKPIRTAIIGAGDCAVERFAPALAKNKSYKLVTVIDVADWASRANALKTAGIEDLASISYYKLPSPFSDFSKNVRDVDLVYISSPNQYHMFDFFQASRVPVVVIEKPAVTDPEKFAMLKHGVSSSKSKVFFQDHYLLKPTSLCAMENLEGIISECGKIKTAKATFFEEGNLVGLPRAKWLISPEAGGGVFVDIGIHDASILSKILGACFGECVKAEAYDTFPNENFQCETGAYAEFNANGNYFAPTGGKPNVVFKIAKGVKRHQAVEVELTLERANLCLDYNKKDPKLVLTYENGETKTIRPRNELLKNEYTTLLEKISPVVSGKEEPFLGIRDAERSLDAVFKFYNKIGGTSNMKLERTFTAIEDFVTK